MTQQTKCDRCNKVPGSYAKVTWDSISAWSLILVNKDLCKNCFEELFPEWKKKEYDCII